MAGMDDFESRLARIAGGTAAPVDGDTSSKPPRRARRAGTDADRRSRGRAFRRSVLIAVGLGMAVMIAANAIAFNARTVVGGHAYLDVLGAVGPFGVAAGILFVLMIGLGVRDKPHVIGLAIGLTAGWFGEPYAAWIAPDLWSDLYTVQHVNGMLIRAGLRMPALATL